jgi:ADP-heptose:LPS heptosyltransferase
VRETRLFKLLDRWLGIPLVFVGGLWSRFFGVFVGGQPDLGSGQRVLVLKLSALGDTLLLLPCLKALKQAVGPQGRVEFLCTGVNEAALEGLPWVDAVHRFSPSDLLLRPFKAWRLIRSLRAKHFQLALDMDQWLRITPLLSLACATQRRAGFRSGGQHRHYLYHASVRQSRDSHESRQFAALLKKAGCKTAVEDYAGFVARHGLFGARAWRAAGKRVLMHAGCGGKGWQREWPEERWAALARDLHTQGYEVRLSGAGAREAAMNRRIAHLSGGAAAPLGMGPRLSDLVQALLGSRLLVSGNTGVMHLAAGLGVPLLALHGPTDPVKWGPASLPGRAQVLRANLGCSPCLMLGFEYGCKERPCMEAIPLKQVHRACENALKI